MFKTVTDANADTIFRNINGEIAKELKLLRREAEKLDWNLLLDADLGQFGLMSADGFIGQYPYMLPSGYHQADTATTSMVRNLISLFAEKFQPVSNGLERLRYQNGDLNSDLYEARERLSGLDSQLYQTRGTLREARKEISDLQRRLETAQAELTKLKETSNGDTTAETDEVIATEANDTATEADETA